MVHIHACVCVLLHVVTSFTAFRVGLKPGQMDKLDHKRLAQTVLPYTMCFECKS